MKRLLFLLLLIPALSFGQNVLTYGGDVVTYSGNVLTVEVAVYSTEYQAVYDSYTTKPDAATATIWNTCVESWVANGEWATKDIIYVYAAHTNGAGEALINWKLPGTFDATAFLAPTFTADEGFLGNGSTQHINTGGWVPSVNGVNYIQNSASQIIYIRTDTEADGVHGINESVDNKNCLILPGNSQPKAYIKTNDNTAISFANTDGSGMFINTRTAVTASKLYRNKVLLINGANNSTGVPTNSPYALAYNDDGAAAGFRPDQVSLYAWGDGMTQTNVDNFTDPFEIAMDALGKGVIP